MPVFSHSSDSLSDVPHGHLHRDAHDPHVDAYGETYVSVFLPHDPTLDHDEFIDSISIMSQMMKRCLPDIDVILPNFGWVSKECIRDTLSKTTQLYRVDQHVPMDPFTYHSLS